MSENLAVGVVGVGSMGRHHARVYKELPGVDLVGVNDVDQERAGEVARRFDTRTLARDRLLDAVDAASIVVPTRYHAQVAHEALDAGVHVLVEKPFVSDIEAGRELLRTADRRDLIVGVGHVERYNPAVLALQNVLPEVDPLAVAARRQGPPVDRDGSDSVVFDLMIHDIDVVLSIADAGVVDVTAMSVPGKDHVVAQLEFGDGLVATFTASRVTQERIRDLAITAEDCQIDVDYMDQNVQIHRHSLPEYVATDGDVRYRHESVIERPTVETGEPLKNELGAFADAVLADEQPPTTGEDGLRAVALAARVEAAAERDDETAPEVLNA